jgi:hypothetical protein
MTDDILYDMPRITQILGLRPSTFSDFSTVCGRKQDSLWELENVSRADK